MSDRILVVDDDVAFGTMICEAIAERGYEVERATSAEAGINCLQKDSFDLVLLDVRLPGMSGLEALPIMRRTDPLADIIVMTAYSDRDPGIEALRSGAYDFFTKPFSLAEMEVVIKRAFEKRKLQDKVKALQKTLKREGPAGRIIGQSEAMKRVVAMIERLASLETTVLITGESGTGKELITDVIHALSSRSEGPCIKINCAAIPETLIESELFGHEKGAFTGAANVKRGKFEMAKHGTLMLDELGEMPLHLQAKLLRAVEQKQMERLGGVKPVDYDVRIVAATNQDLPDLIKDRRFREDLYYRLNIASIHLPALRDRKEDIPLLVDFFLREVNRKIGTDISAVTGDAMELLFRCDWPGNIRQLANTIERAAIFCQGAAITSQDVNFALHRGGGRLPGAPDMLAAVEDAAQAAQEAQAADALDALDADGEDDEEDLELAAPEIGPGRTISLRRTLQDMEKNLILTALRKAGGIQTKAARILGISPKNLWNKLQKHAIGPEEYAAS